MNTIEGGKKLAEAWAGFGKSPEDAAAARLACAKGERCTLCGNDAAHKVEEDTFGEHRHPYTAYVCGDCFSFIMFPRKARKLLAEDPVRLRECLTALAESAGMDAHRCEIGLTPERNIRIVITSSRDESEESIAAAFAVEYGKLLDAAAAKRTQADEASPPLTDEMLDRAAGARAEDTESP